MATPKESYRDNPKLKRVGIEYKFTKEQVEEYLKCAADPVYFAKYISIISLDRGIVPFAMYDFQKDMMRTFNDNRFVKQQLRLHIFFGLYCLKILRTLPSWRTKVKPHVTF